MLYCKKCGTQLDDDAEFCHVCGTPVPKTRSSSKKSSETQPENLGQTIQREGFVYGVVNLENLPPGHVIDERYEIKAKIGQGGFGAVYRAYDRKMKVDKALKVIPEAVSNDLRAMANLRQEAQTMIRLNHPNIVRVYDFHEEGAVKYIDMEFVDGESLSDALLRYPNQRMPEDEVKKIALQILDGLAYAHSQNVIHRDIKPQNILLTKGGKIKIMDFGIAETVRSSMSVIQNTSTSGTLVYMSPEQLRGKNISKRSDIYSFGATLYELLNSKPPFYTGDITYQILNKQPDPLRHVSKAMNQVLLKCLKKKPDERFQNVGEIIGTLKNFEKLPVCPICNEAKDVKRFTCPDCGKENICINHKSEEGICSECAKKKEEKRLIEEDHIKKKKNQNLILLKQSGKIEKFVKENRGNLEPEDYTYFINKYCRKPIEKRDVIKLLKEEAQNFQNEKKLFKKISWTLTAIVILIVLIFIYNKSNKNIIKKDTIILEKTNDREVLADKLYDKALQYFSENKLTFPQGACALDVAKSLEEYDWYKSNEIVKKIVQKYTDWGNVRFNKGNYKIALTYYRKAYELNKANHKLKQLILKCEEKIKNNGIKRQAKTEKRTDTQKINLSEDPKIKSIGDRYRNEKSKVINIKGNVYDAITGDPLIGANLAIENSGFEAATGIDGYFIIPGVNLLNLKKKLLVSYKGYKTKKIPLENLRDNLGHVRIFLEKENSHKKTINQKPEGKSTLSSKEIQNLKAEYNKKVKKYNDLSKKDSDLRSRWRELVSKIVAYNSKGKQPPAKLIKELEKVKADALSLEYYLGKLKQELNNILKTLKENNAISE